MNGVDYTKSLARERENYQKATEKDREYNRKRLADEEERHANIQKKQRDVFERDRSSMEASHKERLGEVKENTAKLIEDKKGRYHDDLEEERGRFNKERGELTKNFDTRFRDIKDSYSRAFDSERKSNAELQRNQKERHSESVNRLVEERDAKVKDFQDRMIGAGANLREEHNLDKERIARSHEQNVDHIYRDEAHKRFVLKEGLQKDLERTKATHAAETEQYRDHVEDKVKNLAETYNADTSRIAQDYAAKNDKFVDAQAKENYQRNKEHQGEISEVRRNFDRDLRQMEIDRRRESGEGGAYADVAKRQQGLADEQVLKDRISHLRNEVVRNQREYGERRAQDAEKNEEMFHQESVDSANRYQRLEQRLTADKIVAVAKEKEDSNRLHQVQQSTQLAERGQYEHQLLKERNDANDRHTKLQQRFTEGLKKMEEDNLKYMEELRKQGNADKAKFQEENNERRTSEIHGLRRSFDQLMSATVEDYEGKLNRLGQENAKLRDQLTQKVSSVQDEADRRVAHQTKMYEEKRKADMEAGQRQHDQREASLRAQIRELSTSYQRKMDQQQYKSDMTMKSTVNAYENKLKVIADQNAKAMLEKDAQHAAEAHRQRTGMDQEKAQIIAQYENQLTQAKNAHKEQVDRLNDYKRMG